MRQSRGVADAPASMSSASSRRSRRRRTRRASDPPTSARCPPPRRACAGRNSVVGGVDRARCRPSGQPADAGAGGQRAGRPHRHARPLHRERARTARRCRWWASPSWSTGPPRHRASRTSRPSSTSAPWRRGSADSPNERVLDLRRHAEADAQDGPASRQVVDRGDLAGEHPRAATGHRRHHRAEPDACSVAVAAAASTVHGSLTGTARSCSTRMWSQRKKPSQPLASAARATSRSGRARRRRGSTVRSACDHRDDAGVAASGRDAARRRPPVPRHPVRSAGTNTGTGSPPPSARNSTRIGIPTRGRSGRHRAPRCSATVPRRARRCRSPRPRRWRRPAPGDPGAVVDAPRHERGGAGGVDPLELVAVGAALLLRWVQAADTPRSGG